MPPDAISLLRELRPPDPGLTPDEAALARIVATPPERPPRRHRRRALRPALALATAAVAAALVVAPGGSPDVLARAAQAIDDENAILHFRTETRHRGNDADLTTRGPDAEVDSRMEGWQADEGRRERSIFGDDSEVVRDWDAKVMASYIPQSNEVVRYSGSMAFGPGAEEPRSIGIPSLMGGQSVNDLSQLLERARRGEESASLVGETTVRGIDVYEIRIDFDDGLELFMPTGTDHAGPDDQPTMPVKAWRTIYVDRDRFLPVRVVERSEWPARGGELVHSITDYTAVERLPRTPENEKLLEMSPHPGATEVQRGD